MSGMSRLERGAWVATAVLAALGVVRFRTMPAVAAEGAGRVVAAAVPVPPLSVDLLERAGGRVVAGDPFRLDRRPSPVVFRAAEPAFPLPGAPLPPPTPPTTLVLRGTIGGPPWEALVEGLPKRQGAVVVRSGDRFGALRVRRVGRDTVVVTSPDSTWRLTVTRPWQ